MDKKVIEKIEKSYERTLKGDEALEIMGQLSREDITEIRKYFETHNPSLYVAIREDIILFEDLVQLDKKGVRLIMDKIEPKLVGLALKTADEHLKKNFYDHMDKDERELSESVINGAPQKLSEVKAAQKRIMNVVLPLVSKGLIIIREGGEGATEYV